MVEIRLAPPAAKYLKKLKDLRLKELLISKIQMIAENPTIGETKKGDLQGIRSLDVFYNGTNYEIAYKLVVLDDGQVVVVIMAGTRENFYEQLKRYMQ